MIKWFALSSMSSGCRPVVEIQDSKIALRIEKWQYVNKSNKADDVDR